ncbi:RsmD family RNA methyltransferase [Candidatus Vidania fulgoroideae]|nr:RsmD family RNA methyltransferase [Candidatus Vidania fulgoroideae]WDR79287.1 RsmD family RNA methyltransferase [Candidatus Vidania fulgoroideae]
MKISKKIFFNKNIRPTKSNVKKSLFNILNNNIKNKKCVDLFSGSGILGIESLFLGASKVVFNDINYKNIIKVKKNIKKFNFKNVKFYQSNAYTLINRLNNIDIIFIDPPYKICFSNGFVNFLKKCITKLNKKGLIYLECSKKYYISSNKFNIFKKKSFGNTSFFIISN